MITSINFASVSSEICLSDVIAAKIDFSSSKAVYKSFSVLLIFETATQSKNPFAPAYIAQICFGTVLVLGVNEAQMRTAVDVVFNCGVDKFPCDIIHDPTYPLQDGDTTHFIPVDTCGYIFGDKDNVLLQSILGNFELHY